MKALNLIHRWMLACALAATGHASLAASTVVPPNLSGGLAGTIAGHSSTSSRGASEYAFPTPVPPGSAGLVPALGMSYDSDNGLDLSGLGWRLSGMPSITRCKRTVATDGAGQLHAVDLTAADAYCLDGERLVKITGTDGATAEYRTEVESFQRIKSFGSNPSVGPTSWTVESPDGKISTFGSDGNATVALKSSSVNWVWLLRQTKDQHNNYVNYVYQAPDANNPGEHFPVHIYYTGNANAGIAPYNAVDFVYETRNDVFAGYVAGAAVKRSHRLKTIQARIGIDGSGAGGSIVR